VSCGRRVIIRMNVHMHIYNKRGTAVETGAIHMHEFDVMPSFLSEPVEPVCQSASVLQKIERVTAGHERGRVGCVGGQTPEHFPALNEQLVQHALVQNKGKI
jgi:hypothetical protein